MTAAKSHLGSRVFGLMRAVLGLGGRVLQSYVRVPEAAFFAVVQPLLYFVLFRYVLGGVLIHPHDLTTWLIPAIFLQAVVFGSVGTAVAVSTDSLGGQLRRFARAPYGGPLWILGRMVGDFVRHAVVLTVLLLAALSMGAPHRASVPDLGLLVLGFAVLGALLSAGFGALGALAPTTEVAQMVGVTIAFPVVFISSAFAPATSMPGVLRVVASHSPATTFVDEGRSLLVDGHGNLLFVVALVTAAVVAVGVVIALLARPGFSPHGALVRLATSGLAVEFGAKHALRGVDIAVGPSETLAIVGPNGAGKTTLIRCVTRDQRPTRGTVSIDGRPVDRHWRELRGHVGVLEQRAVVDDHRTPREQLELLWRLHGASRRRSREQTEQLLDAQDLLPVADTIAARLSGGTRRRLDLAMALVGSPGLLVLDEPTTGLDVVARETLWARVREFTAAGGSVLMTTQVVVEAETEADRVLMLAAGRVVAVGEPAALRRRLGGLVVEVELNEPTDGRFSHRARHWVQQPAEVQRLLAAYEADGASLTGLIVRDHTLDEVVASLSGSQDPDNDSVQPTT